MPSIRKKGETDLDMESFITGNSFPLNLIRRAVTIVPEQPEHYRRKLRHCAWKSYWGHPNTLPEVNRFCGADLKPDTERPALTLDGEGYPCLAGQRYRECWVVSPEYAPGFRPAPGEEVSPDKILSWQILRIQWE